jgi:Rieske Fe-S protein
MSRRELLASSWKALAGALTGLASLPALVFWWRSARLRDQAQAPWTDLGSLSRLEEGGWQKRTILVARTSRWRKETREETVYLRRTGDEITVITAVCPHTGCLVRIKDDGFACPCHASAFDAEGRSLAGPSPRPLDRLETRVEKGRLLLRYRRFRPGTARVEPIEA